MGEGDGLRAKLRAGVAGAGLDLEAKFEAALTKLDDLNGRMAGLEEYWSQQQMNWRFPSAVGAVPNPAKPFVLDLGQAAPGMVWSLEAVAIGHIDPLAGAGAIANVAGAVFIGSILVPQVTGAPSSVGQCLAPALAVPSFTPVGGRKGIIRRMDHLYVILSGSGLVAGDQWFANATVTEAVDTPQAIAWF